MHQNEILEEGAEFSLCSETARKVGPCSPLPYPGLVLAPSLVLGRVSVSVRETEQKATEASAPSVFPSSK